MKVYVVLKESGEYSERDVQLVGVLSKESAARDLIAQKTTKNRADMVRYDTWLKASHRMHMAFKAKYDQYIFEGGPEAEEAVAAFEAHHGKEPSGSREENYTLITTNIDEAIS